MRFRASGEDLSKLHADIAVAFAYEGDREPRAVQDRALRKELAAQMAAEEFRGKPGDRVSWNADGRYASRRFVVIGLGPSGAACGEALRIGAARAASAACMVSANSMALRLPEADPDTAAMQARAAAEGVMLGAYRFERYISDPARQTHVPRKVEISTELPASKLRKAVSVGEIGGRAVHLARDLVNEPPSRMTPTAMASRARREARRVGLRCTTFGRPQLEKLGLSAMLSVSRGSSEPPRLVHLVYRPAKAGRSKRRVMLVGKGVTFDSGGLNLKPGSSMLTMKSDMAGAAAVLATMSALPAVGCRIEVHGLLGLVENMTGAAAYKPGDILDTFSGMTVEVGNTDAEGRLVLADVLSYGASKLKPTHAVDVATLTGACVVALGLRAAGLFTRHDGLREELLEAASRSGEKVWPMPMYDEYLQLLQKGPADLHNIGGKWGGAITAALFLGEFVPRDLPWAHLDIAGPSFTETDLPDATAGGTGSAVLTLLRWLQEGAR